MAGKKEELIDRLSGLEEWEKLASKRPRIPRILNSGDILNAFCLRLDGSGKSSDMLAHILVDSACSDSLRPFVKQTPFKMADADENGALVAPVAGLADKVQTRSRVTHVTDVQVCSGETMVNQW